MKPSAFRAVIEDIERDRAGGAYELTISCGGRMFTGPIAYVNTIVHDGGRSPRMVAHDDVIRIKDEAGTPQGKTVYYYVAIDAIDLLWQRVSGEQQPPATPSISTSNHNFGG